MGQKNAKHGMSYTKAYRTWYGMISRCYSTNNPNYKNYGARGIYVLYRWLDFENFYIDMGDPPENKSLDRIDNDGPYSRENCRWATRLEQARNRRKPQYTPKLYVRYEHKKISLKTLSKLTGISYQTLYARIVLQRIPVKIAASYGPREQPNTPDKPRKKKVKHRSPYSHYPPMLMP